MEAVEEARKKVEHARNRQREAANSLHDAITAAKFAKATRVVDQVCEKVDEYLAKVEKAEKAITEAEAMEKQWHNEMERYKEPMLQAPTPKPEQKAPTSKLEQETATPKPEQETPTPKLEQEALIAMMQSSLEQQLAAEVESTVAEGQYDTTPLSELTYMYLLLLAFSSEEPATAVRQGSGRGVETGSGGEGETVRAGAPAEGEMKHTVVPYPLCSECERLV